MSAPTITPEQLEDLKVGLTIISGLAQLIIEDERTGQISQWKAKQIERTVGRISMRMGWHTEAAEIREAVGEVKGESK